MKRFFDWLSRLFARPAMQTVPAREGAFRVELYRGGKLVESYEMKNKLVYDGFTTTLTFDPPITLRQGETLRFIPYYGTPDSV